MSDPRGLKKVLLEDASTEQKAEFAKMLAEQCAEADLQAKGHRCYCIIPNAKEYAIMSKYAEDDACPKCSKDGVRKGAVRLYIYHDSAFGDSYSLECTNKNCDFKESANDYDRW